MGYTKDTDFQLRRGSGASRLDTMFRLDSTHLDRTTVTYEDVPVSNMSVTDGYTLGQNGEQSIDPATAVASFKELTDDATPAAFLNQGDYVEATYQGQMVFRGLVRVVRTSVEPSGYAEKRGKRNARAVNYQLASVSQLFLSRIASWSSLPAETAYDRLSRWFNVDASTVNEEHAAQLSAPVPAEENPGSTSLLEIARNFSAASGLPLRLAPELGSMWVQVFDHTVPWTDAPLVPYAPLGLATDWANHVEYTNGIPTALDVRTNDVRFADSSFSPPMPIDVAGFVLPALKLTQSFGLTYQADIELDATGGGDALAAGEVTQKTPSAPEKVPTGIYEASTFGVRGDGRTPDTLALQVALNTAAAKGGGQVRLGVGDYVLDASVTMPSRVSLVGAGRDATYIYYKASDGAAFTGDTLTDVTFADFTLVGPGVDAGTSAKGIWFTNQTTPVVSINYRISLVRLMIRDFPDDGIWIQQCIVSQLDNVVVQETGGYNFRFTGINGGAAATSVNFNACYGNNSSKASFYLDTMTYCAFNACASDSAGIGYFIKDSAGISFNGSGCEYPRYVNAEFPGDSIVLEGSIGVVLDNPYTYMIKRYGILMRDSPSTNRSCIGIIINAPVEFDPQPGAIAAISTGPNAQGELHGIFGTSSAMQLNSHFKEFNEDYVNVRSDLYARNFHAGHIYGTSFRTEQEGDAAARFFVSAQGTMSWGTGAADGDTNLYRVAPGNELGTDGGLMLGGNLRTYGKLRASGNIESVATGTLGAIVGRYRVEDADGNLLGYQPIYNSIT